MAADDALTHASKLLTRALAQGPRLQDVEGHSDPSTDALYQRLLTSYADEIINAAPADRHVWLLRRLASIEARLMQLQAAVLGPKAEIPNSTLQPEDVFSISRSYKTFSPILTLAVDDSLVETGLYSTERLPSGVTFRWIGPEPRATIFLPRIEEPVSIVLRVLYVYPKDIVDKIRISIDEGPWCSCSAAELGSEKILTFTPNLEATTAADHSARYRCGPMRDSTKR